LIEQSGDGYDRCAAADSANSTNSADDGASSRSQEWLTERRRSLAPLAPFPSPLASKLCTGMNQCLAGCVTAGVNKQITTNDGAAM
jgi:hypothetical protein